MMRELSLFTGAGGGLLGTKLLGWKHYGYVEFNDYCQRVIAARIKDGLLDEAPIFGDIRTFISEGYADSYRGMVDVVTAGFPCQPFSVAGKRKASDDSRNMWPATIEVIRAVRPKFCLLENVPGLLSATVDDESGRSVYYFGEILRDLAESGYSAKWRCLSAKEVGAPHLRNRLWIVCTNAEYDGQFTTEIARGFESRNDSCEKGEESTSQFEGLGEFSDSNSIRPPGSWWSIDPSNKEKGGEGEINRAFYESRWGIESRVGRVADGVADRMDRLKALGNGQVSKVVSTAWQILNKKGKQSD